MDGDGAGVGQRRAPDPVQQLVAGERLARVGGDELEQVELPLAELDLLPVEGDAAGAAVDLEAVEAQRLGVGAGRVYPAQDCVDAGDQLARRERLAFV